MTSIIYFFPFIGAFIGYFSSYLTVLMLFKSYQSGAVADKLLEALMQKLKGMDLNSDLDELLEKHLVEFIETLKQQIPMAGMFLTGTLTEKLKTLAKQEFIKILPELKDKIWIRFSNNFSFIELLIKESVSKKMQRIAGISAIFGFIVGLLASIISIFL